MARGAPVGASVEMVAAALGEGGEELCRELVRRLRGRDKMAAERAARSLKKVAEAGGAALDGLHKELFREAMGAEDVRVRWNLIIVVGKLRLKGARRAAAVDWLWERLERDEGGLVRTFALQALWDLSEEDAGLRRRVMGVAAEFVETGTPAMRARARRLLGLLGSRR